MTSTAAETAALSDRLSDERAQELLDYARTLVEKEDNESWERTIEGCVGSSKLDAFFESADREIAAGMAEPLDESKL